MEDRRHHPDRRASGFGRHPGPTRKTIRDRVAQSVLVAEPDGVLAELYRLALEDDGWEVDIVSDGHAALARAIAEPPGVLLLSSEPEVNAMTVLRRLRSNPSTRDLAVILLINSQDEADQWPWHELGDPLGLLIKSRPMRAKLSEAIIGMLERRTSTHDRRVPARPGR